MTTLVVDGKKLYRELKPLKAYAMIDLSTNRFSGANANASIPLFNSTELLNIYAFNNLED